MLAFGPRMVYACSMTLNGNGTSERLPPFSSRSIPIDTETLVRLRLSYALEQRELAIMAETSTVSIWRLENGQQNASLPMLRRLAYCLNVSPVDLVHDDYKRHFRSSLGPDAQ